MSKIKSTTSISSLFCPEFQKIVAAELAIGNIFSDPPNLANWPATGSVFGVLKNELSVGLKNMPDSVTHTICNDIHFGWHDQCLCKLHEHMLVAGTTRSNSSSPSTQTL